MNYSIHKNYCKNCISPITIYLRNGKEFTVGGKFFWSKKSTFKGNYYCNENCELKHEAKRKVWKDLPPMSLSEIAGTMLQIIERTEG
jgi:hypothetical protein